MIGRFISMKTSLKLLLAVGVFAMLGGGAATFASFSAQTTNAGNTFATGTLVLSNQVNSGTACLSTGGGSTDTNASTSCDKVFNVTVQKPGDVSGANLTLHNAGSLPASVLSFAAATCTPSSAGTESFHGSGNPCTALDVTVQEYSDAGFTTPSKCWYGGGTATTCAFDDTKTLSTLAGASPLDVSAGPVVGPALTAATGGQATRYFSVQVKLPSTAGNALQGRQATTDFTWTEQQ